MLRDSIRVGFDEFGLDDRERADRVPRSDLIPEVTRGPDERSHLEAYWGLADAADLAHLILLATSATGVPNGVALPTCSSTTAGTGELRRRHLGAGRRRLAVGDPSCLGVGRPVAALRLGERLVLAAQRVD